MTGTIELDRDGRHLVIRFPYDEFLVEEVKKLPKRRWDRADKAWRVPADLAEDVVDAFMKHGFQVSADVMGIVAGTVAIAPPPGPQAGADEGPEPLTVSALNERVRDTLRDAFMGQITVRGRVDGFDAQRGRRHAFFQLVDKALPESERVDAIVEVALFERARDRIVTTLAEAGTPLADGLLVEADVKVDVHPSSGRYQLVVEDLRAPADPTAATGDR